MPTGQVDGGAGAQRVFVQVVRADDFLLSQPKLDVVKVGIEEFEPKALAGLQHSIAKHKPIILSEYSPWHLHHRSAIEPIAYLHQLVDFGYSLAVIAGSGIGPAYLRKPSIRKSAVNTTIWS